MGQTQSTSIEFEDCWRGSSVDGDGRILSQKASPFTQYSSATVSTTQETTIICKVHESKGETIAFGLFPRARKSACQKYSVGDSQLGIGSIGCHVSSSSVRLVKNGHTFFEGAHTAGSSFTITMKIKHGKLSFLVDNGVVNSDELQSMTFDGKYNKLGVSMCCIGQVADVFFACPVTFQDIWSAGDVTRELLTAKQSSTFTFFSTQQLQPTMGRYKIIARVLKSCRQSVGLGIVPRDCKDMCQTNLPGMNQGSIACVIKDDCATVFAHGSVIFTGSAAIGDSYTMSMKVEDGRISFYLNGSKLDCDALKAIRLCDDCKVGVGLSHEGQVVEMRGEEGSRVPFEAPNGEMHQLAALLSALKQSDDDELLWRDNMKSVDCDQSDRVAVCVKKFTATLFTRRVVAAKEEHSVDIRILKLPPKGLMMIGVMDQNTKNHESHHLGAAVLTNSLGLTNRGDLILKGETMATGLGFGEGDLVSMSFNDGTLLIKVNDKDAVPELGGLGFQSKFRWAVSFTEEGQAVKIGSEDLSAEEDRFCVSHGVVTHRVRTSVTSTQDSLVSRITDESPPADKSGRAPESSFSKDSIQGSFIDVADIVYGGRSLGEGSFGKVFKGEWDGSDVAIKEIPWDDDDLQLREIAVGRSLTHPNIATILGWSRKDDKLLVLSEVFPKGSIADRIAQISSSSSPTPSTGGAFGFKFTFDLALGLLRAIKFMASREPMAVVHRDIKPANILIGDKDQPMLTDFGTARSLTRTVATTCTGTPLYMAPEQALGEGTSSATDVHAAAMVIYEVLCAPRPARKQGNNLLALMKEIASGSVPEMDGVPSEIASILRPAFSADPGQRPSAGDMVSMFESLRPKFVDESS